MSAKTQDSANVLDNVTAEELQELRAYKAQKMEEERIAIEKAEVAALKKAQANVKNQVSRTFALAWFKENATDEARMELDNLLQAAYAEKGLK